MEEPVIVIGMRFKTVLVAVVEVCYIIIIYRDRLYNTEALPNGKTKLLCVSNKSLYRIM